MWNIISLRLCVSVKELRRYILGCLPQTHPHTPIFQSHMTCWKASVRWITFPFAYVCVKLHLHHSHTQAKTLRASTVDINKGAIIMNVIRSAEGKEKMSKKIYYPLGCVLKHTCFDFPQFRVKCHHCLFIRTLYFRWLQEACLIKGVIWCC